VLSKDRFILSLFYLLQP